MKPDNRTEKRKLGDIGENVACDFLKKKGFEIKERNYLRKWGEIDIVAKKSNIIHFIEVKSARLLPTEPFQEGGQVSRVTDRYRPEDNMHPWKLRRLSRVIQTYLLDKKLDQEWRLDLITVKIDQKNRLARAEIIENIII